MVSYAALYSVCYKLPIIFSVLTVWMDDSSVVTLLLL